MSGEEFCRCFYSPHPTKSRYYICLICPTGAKARVSERGYNNLKPHVITSHLADIQSIVEMYRSSKDQEANGNNTLLNYAGFVGQRMSPAGTQLFSCLEYCILEDAPFSWLSRDIVPHKMQ